MGRVKASFGLKIPGTGFSVGVRSVKGSNRGLNAGRRVKAYFVLNILFRTEMRPVKGPRNRGLLFYSTFVAEPLDDAAAFSFLCEVVMLPRVFLQPRVMDVVERRGKGRRGGYLHSIYTRTCRQERDGRGWFVLWLLSPYY